MKARNSRRIDDRVFLITYTIRRKCVFFAVELYVSFCELVFFLPEISFLRENQYLQERYYIINGGSAAEKCSSSKSNYQVFQVYSNLPSRLYQEKKQRIYNMIRCNYKSRHMKKKQCSQNQLKIEKMYDTQINVSYEVILLILIDLRNRNGEHCSLN